jgi:hypothetical protein
VSTTTAAPPKATLRRSTKVRGGLRLRVVCDRACRGTAVVRSGRTVLGRAAFRAAANRAVDVRVKLKRRAARMTIVLDVAAPPPQRPDGGA